MSTSLTPGTIGIIDWLGELGPRWGLPHEACRVHALLFLIARPLSVGIIADELAIDTTEIEHALAWLADNNLVALDTCGWSTNADPWMLVTQALETRRTKEMGTARAVRAAWNRDREGEDLQVARQAQRLFDLVEDIASLDESSRRLSPEMMRSLLGVGGVAARLANRAFGAKRKIQ